MAIKGQAEQLHELIGPGFYSQQQPSSCSSKILASAENLIYKILPVLTTTLSHCDLYCRLGKELESDFSKCCWVRIIGEAAE